MMKFTSLLFAAMVATSQADVDESQRGLVSLAQKWNISDPTFAFDSLQFNLTYSVSTYIAKNLGMVKYSVWDENCDVASGSYQLWDSAAGEPKRQPGLDVTDDIQSGNLVDTGAKNPPSGGAAMDGSVKLTIDIDENTIDDNSNIYTEETAFGDVSAEIRFCVRFELYTPDYLATPVEVNFLETIVTLNVDLSDGFEIGSIAVEPKDRLVRTANQVYRVTAYQCNDSDTELSDAQKDAAKVQGSVIRVCVKPDTDATADGIFMRAIDSFEFIRNDATPAITQTAIEDRAAAANLLTTYTDGDCRGAAVCHFSTILFADFYQSVGQVEGSGVASMQFGSNSRRLGQGDRNLQEDSAAAAEFELEFGVVATTETPSGAAGMGAMLMTGLLALSGVAVLM